MKRLNLRTPKTYNLEEQSETVQPRIRFYCVSEGATEESYFRGVRNNRVELGIKNDVFIEVIEKKEGQETLSHPIQLIDACLIHMGRIDSDGNDIPEKEWERNCTWDDFDPNNDQVCVIFDRDYKGLEAVRDVIFEKCSKHGIHIILSNPNFELWLLMHFPNIEQYDPDMLLQNKKNLRHQLFEDASVSKKYLEILVSKNAEGYSKGSKLRFERFLPGVNTAVKQAKLFCENSREVMDRLGTAVGKLIEEMRFT